MGRRNTQVECSLHWKTKAKSLARVRSIGTLAWLGFERVRPIRALLRGSIVESMHWMVLRRPFEPAGETGKVEASTHVDGNPVSQDLLKVSV